MDLRNGRIVTIILERATPMNAGRQPGRMPVALWLVLLALSACAGPVYLNRLAYAEGWREGVVTEVGGIDHGFGHAAKDCRSQVTGAGSPPRIFARVYYQYARNVYTVIAAVPENTHAREGDVVYVHSADCAKEIVPR